MSDHQRPGGPVGDGDGDGEGDPDLMTVTATSRRHLGAEFARDHPDLIVTYQPPVDGVQRVRIASAARWDVDTQFGLSHRNAVFFETPLVERSPEPEEFPALEQSHFHDVPEECYAFEMPRPEVLRSLLHDADLDAHPGLTAVVEDPERRQQVVTDLQEQVARHRYRANKLDTWKGYPDDTIMPEWDPDADRPLDKSHETLSEMARMAADASLEAWQTSVGLRYYEYLAARLRMDGINHTHLEARHFVATEVLGHEDQNYCIKCGALRADDLLLRVEVPLPEDRTRTERVCDRCAERKRDHGTTYSDEMVARAKDARARRRGEGQRRLEGDYEDESDSQSQRDSASGSDSERQRQHTSTDADSDTDTSTDSATEQS